MADYKIILVYGKETRTWHYNEKTEKYGCAECCNGDRCDGDCDSTYRRPNCPHCKGLGWVKEDKEE